MNTGEWGLLLVLSGLWGSSFFFYKILDRALPPLTLVLGRVAIAAFVLNILLMARRQRLTAAMPWAAFVILGTLNSALPFVLFAWGETLVSSGMAAMLNATTPLFAVLLAHVLRAERLTWRRGAGVLAGWCGVIVLMAPSASTGPHAVAAQGNQLAGEIACLVASLSYAVAGQFGRRLRHLPSLQVATGQLTGATLVLLPLAAATDRFWTLPMPSATVWSALAGIALLCTALAYMLFFRLTNTAGPTNAMLVTLLLPISALLLGRVFLGEHVPAHAYSGMALVGVGLAAIDGRLLKGRSANHDYVLNLNQSRPDL